MADTLAVAGLGTVHIELGHVAIYRALAAAAGLPKAADTTLFEAVQRKAVADIRALLAAHAVASDLSAMIVQLPTLLCGGDVLARAREALDGAPAAVGSALDELEATAESARLRRPELELGFDLSELHGYHYHTGSVFSAYAEDHGQALARGGRYDDIGGAFGRGRPATGFDLDLKVLADLAPVIAPERATLRLPPLEGLSASRMRALWETVAELRAAGMRVLPESAEGWPITASLAWDGTAWVASNTIDSGRTAPSED
jgi:ATP phosphoribosyltransferase regulatory subunit